MTLKTPYKTYFNSIREFLVRDELKPSLKQLIKNLGGKRNFHKRSQQNYCSLGKTRVFIPSGQYRGNSQTRQSKICFKCGHIRGHRDWLREEFSVLEAVKYKIQPAILAGALFFWRTQCDVLPHRRMV